MTAAAATTWCVVPLAAFAAFAATGAVATRAAAPTTASAAVFGVNLTNGSLLVTGI